MEYHIIYVLSWRGEKGREKRSVLKVYTLLSAGCNTLNTINLVKE